MMTYQNIQSKLTDEERMLIRHCSELHERAVSGSPAFSPFLSPRERFILESVGLTPLLHADELATLDAICFFWGGFSDAERTKFVALPSYVAYSLEITDSDTVPPQIAEKLIRTVDESVFSALYIKGSGYVNLTHRDYLGALLGLGIDRSVLGDILPDKNGAMLLCQPSIADFLQNNLSSVGRDKVSCRVLTDTELTAFADSWHRSFEDIRGTVASCRLDAVVSELTHASRETAKEMIHCGLVEQNFFTAADTDAGVSAGDIISVRKEGKYNCGKFIIDQVDTYTQKGRIRLFARKYT